jgi:hypothetical protein
LRLQHLGITERILRNLVHSLFDPIKEVEPKTFALALIPFGGSCMSERAQRAPNVLCTFVGLRRSGYANGQCGCGALSLRRTSAMAFFASTADSLSLSNVASRFKRMRFVSSSIKVSWPVGVVLTFLVYRIVTVWQRPVVQP